MLSDSHFEKSFCSVEQMIAGKQDGVIQNEKGKGLVITNVGEIKKKNLLASQKSSSQRWQRNKTLFLLNKH